jgi:hypothetical protein
MQNVIDGARMITIIRMKVFYSLIYTVNTYNLLIFTTNLKVKSFQYTNFYYKEKLLLYKIYFAFLLCLTFNLYTYIPIEYRQ